MDKHIYKVGDKLVVRTEEALRASGTCNMVVLQYRRFEIDAFAGMELTISNVVRVNSIPWYNVELDDGSVGHWHQDWFVPPTGEPEPEDERLVDLKRWFIGKTMNRVEHDYIVVDGKKYELNGWWSGDDRDASTDYNFSTDVGPCGCDGDVITDIVGTKLFASNIEIDFLDTHGEVMTTLFAYADTDSMDSGASVSLRDENRVDIELVQA